MQVSDIWQYRNGVSRETRYAFSIGDTQFDFQSKHVTEMCREYLLSRLKDIPSPTEEEIDAAFICFRQERFGQFYSLYFDPITHLPR